MLCIEKIQSQEIIDGLLAYNYNATNGLAHNQVHCALEDRNGYMWFGTGGGGVSRFDGTEFRNYSISEGLLNNEVFYISEDQNGKIWFATMFGQLFYFENKKIFSYEYNESIEEWNISNANLYGFDINTNNEKVLSFRNNSIIKINSKGKIEILSDKNAWINTVERNGVNLSVSKLMKKGEAKDIEKINIIQNGQQNRYLNASPDFNFVTKGSYGRAFKFTLNGHKFTYGTDKHFWQILENEVKPISIPKEIYSRQIIVNIKSYDGLVWVMTKGNGIFRLKLGKDGFEIHDHIFKEDFITNIYKSKETGLWFSSHKNGIWHIPHPLNTYLKKFKATITDLKNLTVINDSTFAYSLNTKELIVQSGNTKTSFDLNIIPADYIKNITFKSDSESMYVTTSNCTYKLENIYHSEKITQIPSGYQNYLCEIDNQIFFGSHKSVSSFNEKSLANLFTLKTENIMNDFAKYRDTLYCCTNKGLSYLNISDNSFQSTTFNNIQNINQSISKLLPFENGLWLFSREEGISFFQDNMITYQYPFKFNHKINDVSLDDHRLYISTDNGVYLATLDKQSKIKSIEKLDKKNGLSSNEVYAVRSSNDKTFFSTKLGYDIIDKSTFNRSQKNIPIHLKIQTIDSTYVSTQSQILNLNHHQNDFHISIKDINLLSMGESNYRYKYLDKESKWNYINSRDFQLTNLPPGNYELSVQPKDQYGEWQKGAAFKFSILPVFWQRWWFKLALIAITLLATFSIFKRRENQYRKQLAYENEIKLS